MMIVDAQVRIWDPDTPARPWPSGRSQAHRPRPFSANDLLEEMDAAGVALEAARLHPQRFGVMGRLAIERAESRALIAGWRRQPGMLGLRFTFGSALQRPQVAVKASALPWYSSEPYPYPALHPHIRRVFDAFGPRRMFWGTDLTRLPCSYRQAITFFTEELRWLSASDKEWIMGRAIGEWLGWRVDG